MTRTGCAAVAAALALGACRCGTTWFRFCEGRVQVEKKLPPLEVPPDLTTPARDEPLSGYRKETRPVRRLFLRTTPERSGTPRPGSSAILRNPDKVRLDDPASERWLVVPEAPEKVWPMVKGDFLAGTRFPIKTEVPEAGVMEDRLGRERAKIKRIRFETCSAASLDGAYSTGERDKFRTRLERGAQPNTTEIYISHRGVTRGLRQPVPRTARCGSRPPDPSLEAEFLRRLMVRFGADDARARAQLAVATTMDERRSYRLKTG